MDWFQAEKYGSFSMRDLRAFHLYAGAIIRGRSGRTLVGDGVPGLKLSLGQETLAFVENVGWP